MKSDTGLIMLALCRLPAGVAYLSFDCHLEPTLYLSTFVPSKVYWAKPGRAYPAPDSMHAFCSSELRLEVTLCSLVTSRGFWSEFPTVLDICFVSGRGSRMWRIPWVMFLSCGCTHVPVDTDRPGNTVLTVKSTEFSGLTSHRGYVWIQSFHPSLYLDHYLAFIVKSVDTDPDNLTYRFAHRSLVSDRFLWHI